MSSTKKWIPTPQKATIPAKFGKIFDLPPYKYAQYSLTSIKYKNWKIGTSTTPVIGKLSQSKTSRRCSKHFQKFGNIPKFKGTYTLWTHHRNVWLYDVLRYYQIKTSRHVRTPESKEKKSIKSGSKLKPTQHLLSIFEDQCRKMTLNKAKGFAFKSSAPLGLGPKQMFVQDQIAFAFWADLHLGPGHGVPAWIAFGPETKSQKKPNWIWVSMLHFST